jgi:hypothetical protein
MEDLLALYQQPYDPLHPTVCFDEKSVQLLADSRASLPMQPGQVKRQDYEYKRHGTRNLFVLVEPQAGARHVLVTRRRTKRDCAHALRYLVNALYPDAEWIDLVLDNLNTHTYHALVETFGETEADRLVARLRFHYTPAHGSWLNMAEIELSILSRQCLKRRLPDEWTLGTELVAWELARNAAKATIDWSFSLDDAHRVFAEFYPETSHC